MQKLLTASGSTVEKYWPSLFAKALRGQDLSTLLGHLGSSQACAAPVQHTPQASVEAAEAKKEEKEDEDALAGGIGFGDDEEW